MKDMRIAANIADLTRYDEIPRQCLIAPVIVNREIVQVEPGRLDGAAVTHQSVRPRRTRT